MKAELDKIGAELKPSLKAAFVKKDLLLVLARFGKRMQMLKAIVLAGVKYLQNLND